MGLSVHDLEARVRDLRGDKRPDARREEVVEFPGEDERRRCDPREAGLPP